MRLNVYVPDDLGEQVREALPDLNVSALLQTALRDLLECEHERLACRDCGEAFEVAEVVGEALGRFWRELLWAWEPLVDRAGTAEGAARIGKAVAMQMGAHGAEQVPLPRPARAMRRAG